MRSSTLLVLPWSPDFPAGVSVVVRNLLRVIQERGEYGAVVESDWASKNLVEVNPRSFKLRLSLAPRQRIIDIVKMIIFSPVTLFRTQRFLEKKKIKEVAFHYPSLDALGIALLKKLRFYQGRLSICFHGTDVRKAESTLDRILWRFVFAQSDAITGCSQTLAARIESTFELSSGTVDVVNNGVDLAIFRPEAATSFDQKKLPAPVKKYLISVGSFFENKGHIYLLDAFTKLAAIETDIHLVIVGGEGATQASLADRARQFGVESRFHCLVNLQPKEVAHIMANALLCVQPSLSEAFGMAVIEAGACGIPLLASRVGGHTELIQEGVTGTLFEPKDSNDLFEKLVSALHATSTAIAMSTTFRTEVVRKYTWEVCERRYYEVAHKTAASHTTVRHAAPRRPGA